MAFFSAGNCYPKYMKIVSANVYVGSKQKRKDAVKLDSLNAVAYGLQEATHSDRIVMNVMGDEYYRFSAAEAGKSGKEVPILLRKRGVEFLGDGAYLISERVRPDNTGIAPDRYLTWVRYKYRNVNYCVINVHPNAVVQNKNTGRFLSKKMKRVSQYIASMKQLQAEIKRQQNDGFVVIVTGDMNFRDIKAAKLVRWGPVAVFNRCGLTYHAVGLDYVAWDSEKLVKKSVRVIPASQTGSDHPWIMVDLRPRADKKIPANT